MLQDKEFLKEPPPPSLLQPRPLFFHTPSCFPFLFFPVTIHPCTLRTGVRILWAICIWYGCLCACVWFLERQGWVAVSLKELASEQGPLQAQRSKEQCKAPGSHPADRRRAPYHLHWGGLGRVLMGAATCGLSRNGLPCTGGICVCCERRKQIERGRRAETNRS